MPLRFLKSLKLFGNSDTLIFAPDNLTCGELKLYKNLEVFHNFMALIVDQSFKANGKLQTC